MKALEAEAIDLTLFDAAAGAENGADSGNSTQGVTNPADSTQSAKDKGEVVYGIQDTDPPENKDTPADVSETQDESFDNLIKNKYKKDFDDKIHQIINSRFRDAKNMETKLSKYGELGELLGEKYNINSDNVEELLNAIKNDNSLFEAQAQKVGLTVEQYKEQQRLQRDNSRLQKQLDSLNAENSLKRIETEWASQEEKLKETYPDFNLDSELGNQKFFELISRGWSLSDAYEATHVKDIVQTMTQKALQEAKEKTVNSIRAKGLRPHENGIASSQSPLTIKNDVSKLTDDDLEEIKRRVRNGEPIKF